MRLLLSASAVLVFLSGAVFAQDVSSPGVPAKPQQDHASRAPHEKNMAQATSPDDTESHVGQVPSNLLGPPGQRIPEVGPPPPKTETAPAPAAHNTANCTGANANSTECYTATQQSKGK